MNYRTECYEKHPSIAPRDNSVGMVRDGDNVGLGSINGTNIVISIATGKCIPFSLAGGWMPQQILFIPLIKASDGRVYIGSL